MYPNIRTQIGNRTGLCFDEAQIERAVPVEDDRQPLTIGGPLELHYIVPWVCELVQAFTVWFDKIDLVSFVLLGNECDPGPIWRPFGRECSRGRFAIQSDGFSCLD